MKEYTNGDSLRFEVEFKAPGDLLFDPSSTWGRIYDSSSTVVQSITALTRVSTGQYQYDWQTVPGSHANGVGAFDAYGLSGTLVYRRREKIFQLY